MASPATPGNDQLNPWPPRETRTQREKKKELKVSGREAEHSLATATGMQRGGESGTEAHPHVTRDTHTHARTFPAWLALFSPPEEASRRVGDAGEHHDDMHAGNTTTRCNVFLAWGAEKVPPRGCRLCTFHWQEAGDVETRQKISQCHGIEAGETQVVSVAPWQLGARRQWWLRK